MNELKESILSFIEEGKKKTFDIDFEIVKNFKETSNHFHFETDFGRLYVSKGNSKVMVPVISCGSAYDCPNASICELHINNRKDKSTPLCYACKDERLYPSVKKARETNELVLKSLSTEELKRLGLEVAEIIGSYCKIRAIKYIRFNESSDLASWNIEFLKSLSSNIRKKFKIIPYTYSKSSSSLVSAMESSGTVVQISGRDFIIVNNEEEAKELGLKVCPTIGCGASCVRCPKNLKTAVIKH